MYAPLSMCQLQNLLLWEAVQRFDDDRITQKLNFLNGVTNRFRCDKKKIRCIGRKCGSNPSTNANDSLFTVWLQGSVTLRPLPCPSQPTIRIILRLTRKPYLQTQSVIPSKVTSLAAIQATANVRTSRQRGIRKETFLANPPTQA